MFLAGVFQKCFIGVFRIFSGVVQGCFKECFRCVSELFYGCFSCVLGLSRGISGKFQQVFLVCLGIDSGALQGCFKRCFKMYLGLFREYFRGVSGCFMVLQGGTSRYSVVFQAYLGNVSTVQRVSPGCFRGHEGCFRHIIVVFLDMFQMCPWCVSGRVSGVFKVSFGGVLAVFQVCFKRVLRDLFQWYLGCLRSQGCFRKCF